MPRFAADSASPVRELAEKLGDEFPRFRLVAKEESGFMRRLYRLGLMRFWNRRFLDVYTTTIGYTVYMPASVRRDPVGGVRVLRHERIHILQFQRHPIWFPLSYLLVLPLGITWRARWEMEAYVESMRVEMEETGAIADHTLDFIQERFTGPDYLFMDLRAGRVRQQLEQARQGLLQGTL
jgi:hypothetical protein